MRNKTSSKCFMTWFACCCSSSSTYYYISAAEVYAETEPQLHRGCSKNQFSRGFLVRLCENVCLFFFPPANWIRRPLRFVHRVCVYSIYIISCREFNKILLLRRKQKLTECGKTVLDRSRDRFAIFMDVVNPFSGASCNVYIRVRFSRCRSSA